MRIDRQKFTFAMARACMSMADLQKTAGIPRGTLSGIFRPDKRVRPATVGKIAKALGVDVTEIIED